MFRIIYKATNKITKKSYIGQTKKSLEERKEQHVRKALRNNSNEYFLRSIRKYGIDNFDWVVIWSGVCSKDEISEKERYYIYIFNTYNNGYNMTLGGEGTHGIKQSNETKNKKSIAMKGKFSGNKHPMYGKKHNDNTLQKLSSKLSGDKNHNYGKTHSEKTKQKMSKNHSDVTGENNPMYGKTHSDISRKKMSENAHVMTGSSHPRAKKVICVETKEIFDTVTEASKMYNLSTSGISMVCKGKRKTCGGYKWMYHDEYEKLKEGDIIGWFKIRHNINRLN